VDGGVARRVMIGRMISFALRPIEKFLRVFTTKSKALEYPTISGKKTRTNDGFPLSVTPNMALK
jgi:hypothetical protein